MRTFGDYREIEPAGPSAVTIGNFDGVHRGHRALLARVTAWRDAAGPHARAVVVTFDPHPVRVLAPSLAPPLLTASDDKRRLLARAGIDLVLEQRFDRALAALTPAEFARGVLHEALGARHVVVGYDFTFGARRTGNVETLRALGASLGFDVDVVPPQLVGEGLVASSTKVRELLLEGRVEGAALVLGRPFHVAGAVVVGDQRGRTLGFPTANVRPSGELTPRPGIYAGWLDWGDTPRPAAISVGTNPTFGASELRIEAHVLEAPVGLDLYDRHVHLYFTNRLRDEQRFDGLQPLVDQIGRDCDQARSLTAGPPPESLLS